MTEPQADSSFDDDLPESLRDSLQSRFGTAVSVPSAIDDAILTDARRHLTITRPGTTRTRWKILRIASLTSALAAAAVVLMIRVRPPNPELDNQRPVAASQTLSGDVDGNGRIDIVDAFTLARQLQQKVSVVAVDADGDGRTTQADVDALAQRAVML
ncbi:MAG: dockerin type I domain-containing protein [Planctomycetota bacterium]